MSNSWIPTTLIGISTLVGTAAMAAQPPDVVQSDVASNTAMGTQALLNITSGYQNTGAGNLALRDTTSGYKNTAMGYAALETNVNGYDDAAFGSGALVLNQSGYDDTALGMDALYHNTTGTQNTATGTFALYSNTYGSSNSASGMYALYSNVNGNFNDATGEYALYSNTSGNNNTASGYGSLSANTEGDYNTAVGTDALYSNQIGLDNVAVGYEALFTSQAVNANDAFGFQALYSDTTGSGNTALGHLAMFDNTSGNDNIAIGIGAGELLTTGSYNIDIGNSGAAGDAGKIRIGVNGSQGETFIAGISTAKVTGAAVYVTSSGQLGVLASSERYKTAIAPMGGRTDKLAQLRPVTFHLKSDPNGAVQYGLIAEEVDKVYPELVIRDDKGVIQGVRYDELAPMLLNRVQQQQATITAQAEHVARQDARIAQVNARADALQQQLAEVLKDDREMRAALAQIRSTPRRLAMR